MAGEKRETGRREREKRDEGPAQGKGLEGQPPRSPPLPHFIKKINKIKYSGNSIWRRVKGLAKHIRYNEVL